MKRRMVIVIAAVMCFCMMTGCSYTVNIEEPETEQEEAEQPETEQEETEQEADTTPTKDSGGSLLCFSGTDVNGDPVNTADEFAKNSITVVNMWASWCGPCAGEIPELDEMNKDLKTIDCAVIGFLIDGEDPVGLSDAKDILNDAGTSYLNVICPESIARELGIEAIPTTYFVDSDGNILGDPIVGAYPDEYMQTVEDLLSDM